MRAFFAMLVIACGLSAIAPGVGCREEPPPACPSSTPAGEPSSVLDYARGDLRATLAASGVSAIVETALVEDPRAAAALADAGVVVGPAPESFALVRSGDTTWVVGRDEVGAMYGAFEISERVRLQGSGALPIADSVTRAPHLAVRGYNAYVVLPDRGESCWYFRDASFWRDYLDELAHARIDFLDLHAMYDLFTTLSPNPLLWFASSASFPEVGAVSREERAANARMLETIVTMAQVRGIKVGFLAARSDLAQNPTYATNAARSIAPLSSDDDLAVYTREAVADLTRNVPGLWRLGVRIGEGNALAPGASAADQVDFYRRTYVTALAAPDSPKFYTRSWITTKSAVLALLGGTPDPLLEVKLSAEQLGPSYVPQDGTFKEGASDWQPSYLYEDYLDGDAPYSFVFQLWTSASFRTFRYASYERTRRTIEAMVALSPRVRGFSLQAAHTYGRQRDYWHASDVDAYSPWTFPRDELEAHLFGRLGYDPTTPEDVLKGVLRARAKTDAYWDAEQAGTDAVAWMVTAHTCGPDSRDFAPQLEWGGPVGYWALPPYLPKGAPGRDTGTCRELGYHGPLDAFAIASTYDLARSVTSPCDSAPDACVTTRLSPLVIAARVLGDVARLRAAPAPRPNMTAWERDLANECRALGGLGAYFAHRLRAAAALAVYARSADDRYAAAARAEATLSEEGWIALAEHTAYIKPFEDPYRTARFMEMPFHWRGIVPNLARDDAASIDAVVAATTAAPPPFRPSRALPPPASWLDALPARGPGLTALEITPRDPAAASFEIIARLKAPLPSGASVRVLWKAMATAGDWAMVPAVAIPSDGVANVAYRAMVQSTGAGLNVAIEVVEPANPSGPSVGYRYPDVLEGTPYVTVAP